jgi:hypothetical protein
MGINSSAMGINSSISYLPSALGCVADDGGRRLRLVPPTATQRPFR